MVGLWESKTDCSGVEMDHLHQKCGRPLKAVNGYHLKTGQRKLSGRWSMFCRCQRLLGKSNSMAELPRGLRETIDISPMKKPPC